MVLRKPFDKLPNNINAIENMAALMIRVITSVRKRAPSVKQTIKNESMAVVLFILDSSLFAFVA